MSGIESTFKKDGVVHELVRVEGMIEMHKLSYPESGTVIGYSVMRCRYKQVPFGAVGEVYRARPSSSLWGIHGWSYYCMGRANERFESLL